ncbi:MAG: DUF1667 domain-containing protein [Negativicutes bacterium]|nr:DUF1667 domain-containing protein [Negativicutes bacterium]
MDRQHKITCVVCPRSCVGTIAADGDGIKSVSGFLCKRGEEYGRAEVTSPTRMLTTTVRINRAILPLLPVVSSRPLPRDMLLTCARHLAAVRVEAPVREGDVIVKNILGLGVDIVAARDMTVYEGARFD